MSLDELDQLVSGEGCELDNVAYPPRCNPPRGPLRFRAHDRGGIKLEVSRRRLPLDDFLLSVLFQTGSCIFGGSDDLARFFRGSIAKAFGVESEPIPPRFAPEPADDEEAGEAPEPEDVQAPQRRPRERVRSRAPSPAELASRLERAIHGQDVAVGRVARAVATHLAKSRPVRPESVLLVGPTGPHCVRGS